MSRIYIAGPITGIDDHYERFKAAEMRLTASGYKTINPSKLAAVMPSDASHREYMKVCIALLGLCDEIYMLKGWENSKGATEEHEYAINNNIKILFQK